MNLLQIGEQAGRLDDDFYKAHNEIPWRQIIGVRNRIVHGYDDVDAPLIWQIIQEDLPELAKRLEDVV
ncbi:MAG: DUF86 domain-containing protein [Clostridiales bacterium]|jgi:uncharacterized protein with HEPN domain|nr:DUF86 domain-containing protein [Clostridiales bacterium]